jgi:hypothetical protein
VFTKNYTLDGTLAATATVPAPGDTAVLIRYATPDRSSKNHPVYCFNYYHAARVNNTGTNGDAVPALQLAAMQNYGNAWLAGFSDGATTYHRSRPTGDLCTGMLVKTNLTHRDLPR